MNLLGRSADARRERRWHLVIPALMAAAGIAVINSVGNLAGFVSPYLIGMLKDYTHSNQSGMFMLAAMLVIGAIATLCTSARLVNR